MARTIGRKANRKTSDVKTKSARLYRPDRPVARTFVTEVLVDDASHPLLVERRFESHAVGVAGPELFDVAANFAGVLVFRFRAGLQRIILTDENRIAFNFAAVHLNDFVLEYVGVIVQVIRRERSGDLGELGS